VNLTRGTLLGAEVTLADSWWGRFRGFMGRDEPRRGEGILLVPCNGVHMYGLKFDLDLVFLGTSGQVLAVMERLSPWQRSGRIRGSRYVLELPAGTIEATGTAIGDTLAWSAAESFLRTPRGAHEYSISDN